MDVDKQRENNGKQIGGVTGKGFLPGQSGNPGGRKKGSVSFPGMIKKVLAEEDERLKMTNLEAIIDKAVDQAKLGEARAREWLADRAEGKAVQSIVAEDPQAEWKRIVRECYEVTDG
jgi:hypothetical protein|tara:strand:- start:718 stop:1068 length:351 start_codon:yes stop_codon:yes gene_type:complete